MPDIRQLEPDSEEQAYELTLEDGSIIRCLGSDTVEVEGTEIEIKNLLEGIEPDKE